MVYKPVPPLAGGPVYSQKHQSPSTKSQTISKFQFRMTNGFVSDFGHLVIGNYLEFGIWILGFQCLLGSGCAGVGNNGVNDENVIREYLRSQGFRRADDY